MVTDQQYWRLVKLAMIEKTRKITASKAGMDEKTARKYLLIAKTPSEIAPAHDWRTRKDPVEELWPEAKQYLLDNPGLEGKYLFQALQRKHPEKFPNSVLRTFYRRVRNWRVMEGPPKEVFFPQVHKPGELSASDFTSMGKLGVTIGGKYFDHLIYHFVLTYSNWETGSVAFSESFESFSAGFQQALWQLGAVSVTHRTDCLSACVRPIGSADQFTDRYQALLDYYGVTGQHINPGEAHENGDCEQSHHRFKRALGQALLLRGSRDFQNRNEYDQFLKMLFEERNSVRKERFVEELKVLRRLPERQLEHNKKEQIKVTRASTIHVQRNIYSVPSRLIGAWLEVRLYAERIELWYGQKKMEEIPRIKGQRGYKIEYRHVIDWLLRKPGAFENYRYQSDMFPTSYFRCAYDELKGKLSSTRASREYLEILNLAAKNSETKVNEALKFLIESARPVYLETVERFLETEMVVAHSWEKVSVKAVNLNDYDELLVKQTEAVS